ncbi:M1 family metallopeptidase [Faecalibacter rhinopitheci]|uniref:Aminopeptidase N n=1 Tax=Faecalibacter rhinopitheci TaxID=2779678 RepID=A0A8J7FSD9_9FLAO|nr:M1 family metallopeptidase [Faecalibacter rhinopitheci]MBF0596757.1 M1 family metallopeptidase [Faecalibacter rhinopitheci]
MKKTLFYIATAFALSVTINAQVTTLPPSYNENQSDPTKIYRAEAERINNLVHTKLDLKFDYAKQQANGEAWLTLKPHFYTTQKLTLDAKAMLIHEVALVNGANKQKLNYTYNDEQIFIDLDKAYKKDQEYTIYIKYTARPNEVKQKGSSAISDAKGLYFINPDGTEPNKPTQIWTQGETESSSCWFPTIDKTNQKTSQEIYLTYPEKYVSLSNGLLKSSKKNGNGTKTDYWKFDYKHAPYLFFVGIGDYAIIKDKWKNIDVDYYVEPEYKDYAKEIFGATPDMITFFSNILDYQFPWDKYHQMTARDYVSGAMENTGAVLFYEAVQQKPGELIDENTAEPIIAHELFHHWFGDLVTAESWTNLTVNESFANYSEYLWFEHRYGKEKADEHRTTDIQGYKMGDNFTKSLVRPHYNSREDMFDAVSYNKGGAILHMLRNYLGDEAFFKGLNYYLKTNEFKKAEAVQLRLALEEVSGRDLNWFFDQWYNGSGHPKLNIVYEYNPSTKKVKVSVKQDTKGLFEFPFAIDVVENGKATRHNVWVGKQVENSFEFDASQKPEVVIPNADQVLLADITDNKSIEEFIAQYKVGKGTYDTRRLAVEAFTNAQATNPKALEALINALNDPYEGIRSIAIKGLDTKSPKVMEKAKAKLLEIAAKDPKTKVQGDALNSLNEAKIVDQAIFTQAAQSKSFRVQSLAIAGLVKNNPSAIEQYKNISDDVIKSSDDLVAQFLPTWIKNNQVDKAKLVGENAAFYELIKFQDPSAGKTFEDAFIWMMSNDTPEATTQIANTFARYFGYFKEQNPMVANLLRQTANKGLNLKTEAYKKQSSASLQKQIDELKKAIEKMK